MGVVFLIVPTLVDGTVILSSTLGGSGVSNLCGAVSITLFIGDICTILGCAPGFVSWG